MTSSTRTIRPLTEEDAEVFARLRREGLLDAPLAFASSPDDDRAAYVDAVRAQIRDVSRNVIFGAFAGERLVGIAGLYRDHHIKASHKAHVWGMYVTPSYRRQGLAARLLEAAVRQAGSLPGISWVHLSVSSTAAAARALYEAAGFVAWGDEPDALRHEGETASELHMALRLEPEGGSE